MYNDLIVENFVDPEFVGDIDQPDLEFELGNSVCGDRIKIQVKIANYIIEEIAFRAWGCATSVATANIFCRSAKGATLENISNRDEKSIEAMLGELEPSQHHCVNILLELHKKLTNEATVGEA